MNAAAIASWLVGAAEVYAALGVLFALVLLARGLRRIDPGAAQAGAGFKLLVLPGLIALWPLVAVLLARGRGLEERNAHDRAAREASS